MNMERSDTRLLRNHCIILKVHRELQSYVSNGHENGHLIEVALFNIPAA